jgi:DNA-binding beta-propeller fold protein YncE
VALALAAAGFGLAVVSLRDPPRTPRQAEPVDAPLRADAFQLEPGITGVATGFGSIWVVGPQQISRLDPTSGRVIAIVPFSGDAHGLIAAGTNAIWATDGGPSVAKIDPTTNEVTATVTVGGNVGGLITGDGDIWISTSSGDAGRLVRVRPDDAAVVDEIAAPAGSLRFTAGSIWILNGVDVVRVDPATMAFERLDLPIRGPATITDGYVWLISEGDLLDPNDSAVVRIDAETGDVVATVPVLRAAGIAAGDTGVWVLSEPGSTSAELYIPDPSRPAFVTLIDPMTAEVMSEPAFVDIIPASLAVGEGGLWISHYDTGVLTRIEAPAAAPEAAPR